jgi:hypothetical protein
VLLLVIDNSWAMLASTEHRMRKLLQPVAFDRFIIHEEELVCPRDNAHIDFRNFVETVHVRAVKQCVQQLTFTVT